MAITQLSDVKEQELAGQWHPSLIDTAYQLAKERNDSTVWTNYLDVASNTQGVAINQWNHVAEYYYQSSLKSPTLFFKLLNHILTPGMLHSVNIDAKNSALENLLKYKPSMFSGTIEDIAKRGYLGTCLCHYPNLLLQKDDIPGMPTGINVKTHRNTKIADALFATRKPFSTAIDDLLDILPSNGNDAPLLSVSVVGNSPSILKEQFGEEIDTADIVIRFNHVSDLEQQQAHTGKRTDIWVMSPSTHVTQCPRDTKLVIVSGLHALDKASFYWRKLPSLEKDLTQFPSSIWYELVRQFHAPPSAGTLLLASLDSLEKALQIKTYGMTTTKCELKELPNHHANQTPRSSRHNWEAEIQWLADRAR